MSQKKFMISYSGSTIVTLDEVWPDKDSPENPTVEDVIKVIQDDVPGPKELIADWGLGEDLEITVSDGKKWSRPIEWSR